MKASQPYQPFLLRILHGLNALFVILAIITAFWTYNTYDGRWGRIGLPRFPEIEGIHGTFGLFSLLMFPLFAIYAFRRGQKRLIQVNSLVKLTQIGKPIWWYTLHRLTNTLIIFSLTFACFSGKMMDETWLPKGELNHSWYYVHLLAWVIMVISVGLHLLMVIRVGGTALLMSMLNWQFRTKDNPYLWLENIQQWYYSWQFNLVLNWLKSLTWFKGLEITVLIVIAAAWLIPLFK